ncbi:hypothetical protein GZ77_01735 [Endozoicomonas montiporae]|uniref:YchJ-like middle NTF2-like domain-containing protein n=3 Tax=Endozoicomonas montiporae TaxID=1027273 RepID=A0A081NAC2_9GAMM|nr:YchJ family protein [Endozoicomonas montiporae]KEQ15395.1 hypothetical protein GZ77_01735 [Endozoicomonas montiporae]
MNVISPESLCPCGSGHTYLHCCQSFHNGKAASTAEQLMRSRFCAYYLKKVDYLLKTTWPRQHDGLDKAGIMKRADSTEWTRLDVLRTEAGQAGDRKGIVEFKAWYRDGSGESAHHETSDFILENGQWYFIYPDIPATMPGRNDPCLCGSGKKYKKCCG